MNIFTIFTKVKVTNASVQAAFTTTAAAATKTTTKTIATTTKGEKHVLSRIRFVDFVSFLSYNQIQRFNDFSGVYFLVKLII